MKTVDEIDVSGKTVFLRVGFDVPLDPSKDLLDPARVTDDTRIKDLLPTIQHLIENNAKIILAGGWCGRPKGEDSDYSVAPVAKRLEQLLKEKGILKHPLLMAPDCFSDKLPRSVYKHQDEVRSIVESLQNGQIVYLENVRFDPEANTNDESFSAFMASLAQVYVNDNENQNHRPEATVVSVPLLIAKKGGEVAYGFKYAQVLEHIGGLKEKLLDPKRGSFVFGLCGKKIESDPGITSKISVCNDLIDSMKSGDAILTGGAVTYTFILAQHYSKTIEQHYEDVCKIVKDHDAKIANAQSEITDKKELAKAIDDLQQQKSDALKTLLGIANEDIKKIIGDSYIRWGQEGEQIVFAYNVMKKCKDRDITLAISCDHVIADKAPDKKGSLPPDTQIKRHLGCDGIPSGWLGVGEGEDTLKQYSQIISLAAIYLQSGPYSIEDPRVEECSPTDAQTFAAAKIAKEKGNITIGAGGDTVARINTRSAQDSFSIITTAGGATLELIADGFSKASKAMEEAMKK